MHYFQTVLLISLPVLLLLVGSTSGNSVAYPLYGADGPGWGFSADSMTVPGPDLVAAPGETVSLTLVAADPFVHDFGVDYNDSGGPDGSEPHSLPFGGSGNPSTIYEFNATSSEGVYKYYCYIHMGTMFGRFIVGSPMIRHDVAVTQVSTSTSSVGQGGTPLIIVEVRNEGDAMESFNVATYYDGIEIDSQTVSDLWLDESGTLYFPWSTVNVEPGTYTIRAVASIVTSETYTANNEFKDGTITVLPFADTTPPTWPVNPTLNATAITTNSLFLSWSGPNDNVGSRATGSTETEFLWSNSWET